jgi:hypothetical protein
VFLTKQQPLKRSATIQSIACDANQLRRKLASFGVLLLTLSCLSPVLSIYGVGSDVLLHAGSESQQRLEPEMGIEPKRPAPQLGLFRRPTGISINHQQSIRNPSGVAAPPERQFLLGN